MHSHVFPFQKRIMSVMDFWPVVALVRAHWQGDEGRVLFGAAVLATTIWRLASL